MLFNSIDFAVFLPVVFILYWYVFNRTRTLQNAFLVGASYFFYAYCDWRFLSLIIFSTVVDFLVGGRLATEERLTRRRLWLALSIFSNLGLLGVFKYLGLFMESAKYLAELSGQPVHGSIRNHP